VGVPTHCGYSDYKDYKDKLSYNGFRPSARWVDLLGLLDTASPTKKSIVSERKRNDLYVYFKRNNFTSSAAMLSK